MLARHLLPQVRKSTNPTKIKSQNNKPLAQNQHLFYALPNSKTALL
jgi:hypothetical protein